MKLSDEIEKLQEKNEGKIILIKSGIFFIAIGKDAVVLHDVLGLKTTCMKDRICKVGFPVRNVEKYIRLLNENDLSFIIYVKNEENQIEELYKKGIKVSINPDNDTVSNTNIIEEYKWVLEHTNLTINDIEKMNQNAIRGAFISVQEKSKLISKILKKDEKKR